MQKKNKKKSFAKFFTSCICILCTTMKLIHRHLLLTINQFIQRAKKEADGRVNYNNNLMQMHTFHSPIHILSIEVFLIITI